MWFLSLLTSTAVLAQAGAPLPRAIEDNSFLIEEAYNQEPGVIQHISTFLHTHDRLRRSDYSFTQEWPVGGQRHQLSYTLPYAWATDGQGVGDLYLNYRYQLTGHDAWATLSPRLSVAVPTRGETRGGFQFNLPVSKRVATRLVVHANAGGTYLRGVRLDGGRRAGFRAANVGASAIALVTSSFNVMLEAVAGFEEDVRPDGQTRWQRETTLSPGLRRAFDAGSLQIVPGIAVPVTWSAGRARAGAFVYLSLEHPLR